MGNLGRNAIRTGVSVLALVAGVTFGVADTIDAGLIGAWATSTSDCARIFQKRNGVISYRQPVDKFAQAAIIGPQRILGPASDCRILSVAHVKGALSLDVECKDSVSYTSLTAGIKILSATEIVYSPTPDQTLDTTFVKCAL